MDKSKVNPFDKLPENPFDKLPESINNVNLAFQGLAESFKDWQSLAQRPTNYKCPECGSDLYVYYLLEESVIFYCKECDKKVKGLL